MISTSIGLFFRLNSMRRKTKEKADEIRKYADKIQESKKYIEEEFKDSLEEAIKKVLK